MGWFSKKETKPQASFTQITDEEFGEKVLQADKPVMLFLWSDTCPFCKKMAPNALELLRRHPDDLLGFHARAADAPRIAQAVQLRGVPATAFFLRGKMVAFAPGFQLVDALDEVVHKILGAAR
ncbi:MAG TPA: thioredoxin family protein [bacterium]|nr:thioredoxin family protein [bacterium]